MSWFVPTIFRQFCVFCFVWLCGSRWGCSFPPHFFLSPGVSISYQPSWSLNDSPAILPRCSTMKITKEHSTRQLLKRWRRRIDWSGGLLGWAWYRFADFAGLAVRRSGEKMVALGFQIRSLKGTQLAKKPCKYRTRAPCCWWKKPAPPGIFKTL